MKRGGRLTASVIVLTAFAVLSAAHTPAADRAMSASDLSCSSHVQGGIVPDKRGSIIGNEIHLTVENHKALLFLPERKSPSGSVGWVWYAPMVPREPNERHAFIIQHVLSAGMAFAAIEVGESYGNAEGTRVYAEFHDVLNRCFNLSQKVVLFPQSRGGLMVFNWAALHPSEVERIAGIYPVCDLRSYPGIKIAAQAYGMTEQQLATRLARYNPIDLLSPLAKAGVPMLFIHGDNDKVVPLQDNSAELVRRYQKLGGSARLIVVPGKGHEEVDEFFKSRRFADFLITGK